MNNDVLYATAKILINHIYNAQKCEDVWLTYTDVSTELLKDINLKIDPLLTKEPIGTLSALCHEIGLPLISCIVINKKDSEPGKGFFKLYATLKNIKQNLIDTDLIWLEESKKVFNCSDWDKLLHKLNINHISELNLRDNRKKTLIEKNKVHSNKEYSEGKLILKQHYERERNQQVIKEAKISFLKKNKRLFCEVCGFDFYKTYGEIGKLYIEGHHKKMVSQMKEGDVTKVEDIAMVCCNCHKMLHKGNPIFTIEELKSIILNQSNKI